MDEVLSESSPNTNDESPELSFSVLNACSDEQKSKFRLCERTLLKITCISSHLSFNETCVNIYIYIYIYIFICISIYLELCWPNKRFFFLSFKSWNTSVSVKSIHPPNLGPSQTVLKLYTLQSWTESVRVETLNYTNPKPGQ